MLSKSQARAFFLGGTGLFGAIFLALTVDSMRQIPALTNADKLSDEVVRGKVIWEANNCMGCHTLFGEGAYYAPELTKVVERRGAAWIRLFIKDPQKMFPGQRKMVQYNFTDSEISDVIALAEIPTHLRKDWELYTGCVAGAATIAEIKAWLSEAGFTQIRIEPKEGSRKIIGKWFPGQRIEEFVASATIKAMKPTSN